MFENDRSFAQSVTMLEAKCVLFDVRLMTEEKSEEHVPKHRSTKS